MKRTFVIHPFLFAVSPILFLFAHNIYEVSFSEILLPISIVSGFATLSLLLLKPIIKDAKKAGIIISIFLILFFSYGFALNAVSGWTIGNILIGRQRYLFPIWWILFGISSYLIIRMRKDLRKLTNFLNIATISFVAISIITIGVYEIRRIGAVQIDNEVSENIQTNTNSGNLLRRDIYYIILDSYISSSTSKDIYKYDNHEFTDYLTQKGFYIGFKSRSNYPMTLLSLSSSLNMEYINYLSDTMGIESKDIKIFYKMIENSKVIKFLKSKGYKFINIASMFNSKYADINFRRSTVWNNFRTMLAETTMLVSFIRGSQRREDVLFSFSKLAETPDIEGPKVCFYSYPLSSFTCRVRCER